MTPRPDHPGQGHRRRAARRRLRRPARADGAHRSGRRRLPGGHAVRQPAGHRGRPGHAAPARRRRPTAGWTQLTAELAAGSRRRRPAPAWRCRCASTTGLLTRLLLASSRCATTRTPSAATLERHAAFCRAMLERGDLPAAVAVRGLVSLARPHATSTSSARSRPRRRPSPSCERAGRDRRCRRPRAGADGARPGPGPLRFGGELGDRLLRARGGLRGLPAALRRLAAVRGHGSRPARCWPATRSTRSASHGSPSAATWPRWPSSPT